ncbi:hypothetical protein EGK_08617, partial [Macaca mulatta]
NKRCQLHSLDTHKPKPLGGCWMDVWELMSQECRDEVVLIDSSCLLETLETYLRKHRTLLLQRKSRECATYLEFCRDNTD